MALLPLWAVSPLKAGGVSVPPPVLKTLILGTVDVHDNVVLTVDGTTNHEFNGDADDDAVLALTVAHPAGSLIAIVVVV